jgi:hypothetical protein
VYTLLQALLWWFLFKQLLFFSTTIGWQFCVWVFDNALSVRDVTNMTGPVTDVTYPVIYWNSIIFVHAYTHKWIRWSIFLSVRTVLLISLKRVDALGVHFLNLILRNVFQRIAWSIVLSFLRVCFVVILLNQIIAKFNLLRFWNSLSLIIVLTCKPWIIETCSPTCPSKTRRRARKIRIINRNCRIYKIT